MKKNAYGFFISCIVAIFFTQGTLLASHSKETPFTNLMMQAKDPLSEKDIAQLQEMERDYNRDIDYLSAPPLHHVPKAIHFIWIGPKPFPKDSIENLKSWKKFHPHWEINFWTDSKDRPLPISGMNRRLIQDYDFGPVSGLIASTDSWAEKADLIRYKILYDEGGVYSDHDVEVFRPISPLAKSYDFVVGLEWFNYHPWMDSCVSPCNAIIIARPGHPVLREAISRIISHWDELGARFSGKDPSGVLQRVIARTFDNFALSVKECRNRSGTRDIVLPNSYFYPFPAFDKGAMEKMRKNGYVYAVHKYGGTWKEWNGEEP